MILSVKTTGKSRATQSIANSSINYAQRNEYLFFSAMRLAEHSFGGARCPTAVTRRPEEMPSVPQKPNRKA